MKRFLYNYALGLGLAWIGVIFVLCATPGEYIPSADWMELLSFDKFVHAGMFFILCSLWFLYAAKNGRGVAFFALIFVLGILYGASLEVMQATYFSNRSADWKDMVANGFGCLMAVVFWRKVRRGVTT